MSNISLSHKRILVTGGSGVIGKELLYRLQTMGAQLLSIDRVALPTDEFPNIESKQIDLAKDSLQCVIDFRPEIIFHLAASFERLQESPGFWEKNWQDNMVASHRLLDLFPKLPQLNVFIFASSYLIYSAKHSHSSAIQTPYLISETEAVDPRNSIGVAKYYTEKEADWMKINILPDLRTVHARIFRVYGCGSKDIVSRWIRSALHHESLTVYNEENAFDYIYAGDVAQGLIECARNKTASGVINLGTGTSHTIRDVLAILARHIDKKQVIRKTDNADMYESHCADIQLLKTVTGWSPSVSLEEGIKRIIAYERSIEKKKSTE